jgi:hypothetical protein
MSDADDGARTESVVDYRLGLDRAAHECEWMARGYAAYLMQPLLDAAKRIREIPDDPAQEPHCQRKDGRKPRLAAPATPAARADSWAETPEEVRERIRLLADVDLHLQSVRVFITSREKMHPCGVELHDELLAKVTGAIDAIGRENNRG